MWEVLKKHLKAKKLTMVELSKMTGIHRNTIQNMRNERISFRNMVKIADALDVSLDEFRK
ncbi:helix-turn-helix domain-containing protein [Streptococcus sp. zg-86]|uniref:Helix-turn-helix domain-containing protein n=1 Tax=Streptococcus zhangguiae TaxID=2664091 RepID=A0A6I4R9F0_9STRE|nr:MULTISPECIES: helix-turn-helix transcriptional regulator [unclassified Streptococcus]MTB64111.1 helix-turn-helix domain-containing protein [Streptococcus sp. zg-86]MTB90563.1 helix-turn-helix domain-containing protein [Streptococcus sp. zg-36]MWV56099.1 helix-turn-helix domain-containing protein [Streptococcus sp. zg-70]QTH48272.1 helix-turn-helix transcriptional regulator [Streptococcus sp. zg-86]